MQLSAEEAAGAHPQQHLESFNGTLQADAYGGYQAIYETGRVAWVAGARSRRAAT